jgi:hypothetical protein
LYDPTIVDLFLHLFAPVESLSLAAATPPRSRFFFLSFFRAFLASAAAMLAGATAGCRSIKPTDDGLPHHHLVVARLVLSSPRRKYLVSAS